MFDDRLSTRERESWLIRYGATVAALLAAAGAVATAVITSRSNSADTERRIEHERSLARQQTVGAARVLAKELVTVEVYMQGMLRVKRLIPYDDKYDVELGPADQKRIAAAPEIGVDRWQRVAAALSNLDTLRGYVQDKYERGAQRLDRGDIAVFELDIATIDNAWKALAPLAGTPKLRDDPFGAK